MYATRLCTCTLGAHPKVSHRRGSLCEFPFPNIDFFSPQLSTPMNAFSAQHSCAGKDLSGQPCPCLRFVDDPTQGSSEVKVCRNCLHWDSSHPAVATSRSMSDLITTFKSAATSSKPRASSSKDSTVNAAITETNSEFRRKSSETTKKNKVGPL